MKYCAQCGSEYVADVDRCVDCGNRELISADEMRRRGLPLPGERDTRKFEIAGTAEDPLTAEKLVAVLEAEGISVLSRPRRSGVVDNITGPSQPWWELLVPEEDVARGAQLVSAEKRRIEEQAGEAGLAAEEEEAATKASAPKEP